MSRRIRSFAGVNVFIVGGSSGIGLAVARELASQGGHVVIFARNKAGLARAMANIDAVRAEMSRPALAYALDVCKPRQVREVCDRAVAACGPPALLINCAGRALPDTFEHITRQQLADTMQTNFFGTWDTINVLLPHLKKTHGHIVNVSSVAGFLGTYCYTDHAASKFAVLGFSEALRSELRPQGVSVHVLCPPVTDTPGFERENRNKPAATRTISADGALLQPEKVALALVKGLRHGRFLIIPGLKGKMTYLMKRFFPRLLDATMDRKIRAVHTDHPPHQAEIIPLRRRS